MPLGGESRLRRLSPRIARAATASSKAAQARSGPIAQSRMRARARIARSRSSSVGRGLFAGEQSRQAAVRTRPASPKPIPRGGGGAGRTARGGQAAGDSFIFGAGADLDPAGGRLRSSRTPDFRAALQRRPDKFRRQAIGKTSSSAFRRLA